MSDPQWRRVRMSEEVFLALGVAAVDWGEPDAEGFYDPTLRMDYKPTEYRLRTKPEPLDVERLKEALDRVAVTWVDEKYATVARWYDRLGEEPPW